MLRRLYLIILAALLSRLKIELLRLCGHQVSRKSYIGPSWLDVRTLTLQDGAHIGPFNVFKGIQKLSMGRNASIGRFNQFTASPIYREIGGAAHGVVELADQAVVPMRHYFDCQSSIFIGENSLVAGVHSVFFTHQKGLRNLHEAKPIRIGARTYMGTSCVVLPGTTVEGYAFIGGGSVLAGTLNEKFAIYASPRAAIVKRVSREGAYFDVANPTAKILKQCPPDKHL